MEVEQQNTFKRSSELSSSSTANLRLTVIKNVVLLSKLRAQTPFLTLKYSKSAKHIEKDKLLIMWNHANILAWLGLSDSHDDFQCSISGDFRGFLRSVKRSLKR